MSENYDNWERLVRVVLRREQDREIALIDSSDYSSISCGSDSELDSDHDQILQIPTNSMPRWRQAAGVLNASRRFRYALDLKKQEKGKQLIRAHAGGLRRKIVVRVSMNDDNDKSRCKALKIVACISGVESVALMGQWKDQVEVVGQGIDVVQLTRLLRKKVAHAELVSVGEAKKGEASAIVEAPDPSRPSFGLTRRLISGTIYFLFTYFKR